MDKLSKFATKSNFVIYGSSIISILISLLVNPIYMLDDPLKLEVIKHANLYDIFFTKLANFPYRPFNLLLYYINWNLFGTNFQYYHMINLILLVSTNLMLEKFVFQIFGNQSLRGYSSFLFSFSFIIQDNYFRLGTPDRITVLFVLIAASNIVKILDEDLDKMRTVGSWIGVVIGIFVSLFSNLTALFIIPLSFVVLIYKLFSKMESGEQSSSVHSKRFYVLSFVLTLVIFSLLFILNQAIIQFIGRSEYISNGYTLSETIFGIYSFSVVLLNMFPILVVLGFLLTIQYVKKLKTADFTTYSSLLWLGLIAIGIIGVSPWSIINGRHLSFAVLGCILLFCDMLNKHSENNDSDSNMIEVGINIMLTFVIGQILSSVLVLLNYSILFFVLSIYLFAIAFGLWQLIQKLPLENRNIGAYLLIFLILLNAAYLTNQSLVVSSQWKSENQAWQNTRDYMLTHDHGKDIIFIMPYWYQLEVVNNFKNYADVIGQQLGNIYFFSGTTTDMDISNTTSSLPSGSFVVNYAQSENGIELFSSKSTSDNSRALEQFLSVYNGFTLVKLQSYHESVRLVDLSIAKLIQSILTLSLRSSDFVYYNNLIQEWSIYKIQ